MPPRQGLISLTIPFPGRCPGLMNCRACSAPRRLAFATSPAGSLPQESSDPCCSPDGETIETETPTEPTRAPAGGRGPTASASPITTKRSSSVATTVPSLSRSATLTLAGPRCAPLMASRRVARDRGCISIVGSAPATVTPVGVISRARVSAVEVLRHVQTVPRQVAAADSV
jgi:hypothetical protein